MDAALDALQKAGQWATTAPPKPSLTEPPTADWPSATSYPAMGEVSELLPPEKGSGVPSAYNPTVMAGGTGMTLSTPESQKAAANKRAEMGSMGALQGLESTEYQDKPYIPGGGITSGTQRASAGPSGGYGVPTTIADVGGSMGNLEELMRLANAEPGTTAPGVTQYWQDELKERLEPEDYNRLQARKQQEEIMAGLTAAHPAVFGALEAKARRAAMPQAAYGEAQFQGQVAGAKSRLGVEGSRAAQAEKSSKIAYAGQLATALSRLMSSAQGATDEGQAVAAQLQGLLLATLGDLEDVDMSEFEEEQ